MPALKLFGDGWPASSFVADVAALASLPDDAFKTILDALSSAHRTAPLGDELRRKIGASLALPAAEAAFSALDVLRFVLTESVARSVSVAEIVEDFRQIGIQEEQLSTLQRRMEEAIPLANRINRDVQGLRALRKVVNVFHSMDAAFDLRGVFRSNDVEEGKPDTLLGFEAVALVSLTTSSDDADREHVFQLTLPQMERLRTQLADWIERLKMMDARGAALQSEKE